MKNLWLWNLCVICDCKYNKGYEGRRAVIMKIKKRKSFKNMFKWKDKVKTTFLISIIEPGNAGDNGVLRERKWKMKKRWKFFKWKKRDWGKEGEKARLYTFSMWFYIHGYKDVILDDQLYVYNSCLLCVNPRDPWTTGMQRLRPTRLTDEHSYPTRIYSFFYFHWYQPNLSQTT